MIIRPASTPDDFAAFGRLIGDYLDWCRARYRDDPWFVEAAFGYQSLESELAELSAAYAPPRGVALLAADGEAIVGAVAYRRLSGEVCEMKRLYVSDRGQGRGLGRRLCEAIVAEAGANGFKLMRLDTGRAFVEARALYRSAGFSECAPYNDYPERLTAMMVFMERRLG